MAQFGTRPENAGTYWDDLRIMLKKIRLLCEYSHADVANALGISRSTYTYYENGRTAPDLVTLVALARVYEIPPECFLYPEEFTDLETARQRPSRRQTAVDPQRLGDLSPEERELIAKYRLKRSEVDSCTP